MILKLFGIRKELNKENMVSEPVPFETEEMAKLYFETHLRETPMMRTNPEAYSLVVMGTLDTTSGTIIGIKPEIIMKGGK